MNRRRMSGHRAGGGAESFAIRAPWAVYENDSGVSVTGNGPTMSSWSGTAANVGDGFPEGTSPFVNASPGINLSANFSIGFFREITEDSYIFGTESIYNMFRVDNGTKRFGLVLANFEAADTIHVALYTGAFDSEVTGCNAIALAVGWHHFGVSIESGIASLNIDGVLANTPAAVGAVDSAGVKTQVDNASSGGTGVVSQPVIAAVAYTAAEWAYIFNAGVGRPYSAWNLA